jgi:hypothetical protein
MRPGGVYETRGDSYRENTPAKFEELDKKISYAMSDHEKANQCEAWLLAAK